MIKSHVAPQKYLFEINANCMLQLGIEVNHQKYVDKVINNLSKTIVGLHLKLDQNLDGSNSITHTYDDPPIFQIPNSFKKNFDKSRNSLEQLSNIFLKNYYVSPTTRLGSIGFNDRQIILNLSHSVGDGGYFKYVIEKLSSYLIDDNEIKYTNPIPFFPRESTEIFNDIIEKVPDPTSNWWNQPKVNRVYTTNQNKLEKQENGAIACKYITMRIPINELTNYSKKNRIHNLTNSLLTSLYISTNVHNYSINSKCTDFISMPVCVDLRRYLKKNEIDYSVCNNFSNVTPFANVEQNDTVSSIGHKMKKDMFRLMKEQRDIANLKTYLKMDFSKNKNKKIELDPKNGCGVELTYTGPFNFKEPIIDVWGGHSMNVRSSTISLMGFSIVDESGRNELVLRLRFPPNVFGEEEASNMAKTIEYCLKNVSDNLTIKEAIEKAINNSKYNY